ncbi:hypothetical protein MBLNU230_g3485t1 [Neophaeotheca triangularis]
MEFSMHLSVRISSSVSRLQESITTPGHNTLHSHFKRCGTRRATVSTETTAPSGVEKQVLRLVPSDEEIATEISEKESHTTLPRGGFTLEEMRKQDKKSLDVLLEAWVKIGDEDGEEGLKDVKDAKNEKDGHEKKKNEDQTKQKKNNATASYENGDNASAPSSPSTSLSFTSDDLCAMSLEDLYGLTSLASSGDDGGSDYSSEDVASRVLAPETLMISESKGEIVGDEGRERARELLWFLGSLERFGSAGEESGEENFQEWRFGLRTWQRQLKESEEYVRERDGMCRLCGRGSEKSICGHWRV